jgi:hypothetical protein
MQQQEQEQDPEEGKRSTFNFDFHLHMDEDGWWYKILIFIPLVTSPIKKLRPVLPREWKYRLFHWLNNLTVKLLVESMSIVMFIVGIITAIFGALFFEELFLAYPPVIFFKDLGYAVADVGLLSMFIGAIVLVLNYVAGSGIKMVLWVIAIAIALGIFLVPIFLASEFVLAQGLNEQFPHVVLSEAILIAFITCIVLVYRKR